MPDLAVASDIPGRMIRHNADGVLNWRLAPARVSSSAQGVAKPDSGLLPESAGGTQIDDTVSSIRNLRAALAAASRLHSGMNADRWPHDPLRQGHSGLTDGQSLKN